MQLLAKVWLHPAQTICDALAVAMTDGCGGCVRLAVSVSVKTLKPGDGKTFPKPGQKVKAHYTGKLQLDGSIFDTSRRFLGGIGGIGAFEFQIGAGDVIKGWDVGIAKMSLGETAELVVGPSFGYGARGAGDAIPPNSVLIFEVELLGISGKVRLPSVILRHGVISSSDVATQHLTFGSRHDCAQPFF